MLDQQDLFLSGTGGYHTYRIPAILRTRSGALLAFCEGRRHHGHDSGDIDLLLRRSEDGGSTWSPQEAIWADPGNTTGNPCPVLDRRTGTVWLLLTHNLGVDVERQIIARESQGTRTVWVTRSEDDGRTWAAPAEITAAVKRPDWTWYATGPGAGIQLTSGRLLIPCDHIEADTRRYYSHAIYSDDHGGRWRLGGSTPDDQVNECEAVELEDGRVLLNMRNYDRARHARARSWSSDGGLTWGPVDRDPALVEPICQASIRRWTTKADAGRGRILFSNPACTETRRRLTVRLSYDEGTTWPESGVLHEGPAAYSCLVALAEGTAGCFYERGEAGPYERLTWARFDLDWLTGGRDRG
ncbi:MAG: sialidase family protein [Candidatus Latescibacterota bacterium]|jgi:sialidase-1